ncbi:basic amino acid/polyamine antiporter, APA family [Streptomyces sp. yr375]|nr:basic amino acid/polyamine antiporter, APA family [Streptomyces sp. yr375]
MIGAGIFAALGPAADTAGSGLLLAPALAAVVAYCNATASQTLTRRQEATTVVVDIRPKEPVSR